VTESWKPGDRVIVRLPGIPEEAVTRAADAITLAANHFEAGETESSAVRFARAALEAAAPVLAEAWGVKKRRTPPLTEGLVKINANRARIAAHRDAERGRRALEVLGDRCSQRARSVAEARIASPEAPWSEIAGQLGLTKGQAIGIFRRMVGRVPVRDALREDERRA
jgi:hypothetical protein